MGIVRKGSSFSCNAGWIVLKYHVNAFSKSASSKTTAGLLPPNSRVTRFRLL